MFLYYRHSLDFKAQQHYNNAMNLYQRLSTNEWHQRFIQQAHWTAAVRKYLFDKSEVTPNMRILEVGCGTGAVQTSLMPERQPIYGIDLDLDFLHFSQQNLTHPLQTAGDGHFLPYAENSFDLVCCHFLLLWIKQPQAILKEMLRAAKPGGKIMVFAEPDYGGRIDYPKPLEKLGKAQISSLKAQGADPFMGRKLAELTTGIQSLQNLEIGILGYQSSQNQPAEFWESEWRILEYDLSGTMPQKEFLHLKQIDKQAQRSGQRVMFVPTFYLYAEKAQASPTPAQ